MIKNKESINNVLRGGSWNNNRDNARCAYRNDNNPDNDNDNWGVRLATHASRLPEMCCDILISFR
ncbi:MAG: SUMF1/EgtB/PvdO family nonheme iron enzyme [Chloroflexus sp.]|uniref:SUMF1/EgtB/PvdO family nonheme iron enzyme n=1 Tax=Chloroflexus sp. TaxID=1904827 RepID=UPI00404925D0